MLSVRGSYGTSFQAPSIGQKSEASTAQFLSDNTALIGGALQCTGASQSWNVVVVTKGDADLKPQSAYTRTVGFIVQPVDDLKVAIDLWGFDYKDLIKPEATGQAIVSADCAGRTGLAPLGDPRITRLATGQVLRVDRSFQNIGKVETSGTDLTAQYSLTDINLKFNLNATVVTVFRVDR